MSERLTYTVAEAARLLGVSRGVAYESARTGELPTIRLGRRVLVPRHPLERFLGLLPETANGAGHEPAPPTNERNRDEQLHPIRPAGSAGPVERRR
jgi:excisionase family DNA binding protein